MIIIRGGKIAFGNIVRIRSCAAFYYVTAAAVRRPRPDQTTRRR